MIGYSGFGFRFGMFNVMFTIMFVLVIGMFVVAAVRGISQWNKNNNSPRLTVNAEVISKRTDVTHHRNHHGTGVGAGVHHHTTHSTRYYATFQVESGDRMELQLQGHEFGLIVEGDNGKLTFQGTRYLGFERV